MRSIVRVLAVVTACCALLALPAVASAWEPTSQEEPTPRMHSDGQVTLEVPIYLFNMPSGTLFVVCDVDDFAWTYTDDGATNFMWNGLLAIDGGQCTATHTLGWTVFDDCVLGANAGVASMTAYGDETTQTIVMEDGPQIDFEFLGMDCDLFGDTFSVNTQFEGACDPSYDDGNGQIQFSQMLCLEVFGDPVIDNGLIREGDGVEIEGTLTVNDPTSPFPYMGT